MSIAERFLLVLAIVFFLPWLIWRLGRTERWAPLVVIQILTGIILGPGILGSWWPEQHHFIFAPEVMHAINGVAWWGVMLFVMIAGVELDLRQAWIHKRESSITAGFALGTPMLFGCTAAMLLLLAPGWQGEEAQAWQFILGVGMACAVTALPILVLFLEKLDLLRHPVGQRILRYASLDDLAIWIVLALIMMDWAKIGRQISFLIGFTVITWLFRALMARVTEPDRWYLAPVWLALCALGADWAGLHFMVGAFLAGAVLEGKWFDQARMDRLRHHVLLMLMPVFFLSTGLRTSWSMGGLDVLLAAGLLLLASIFGKLLGMDCAGRILAWPAGQARMMGWLLQTKALIMIIFANILLDRSIITQACFTALLLMAVASTMLTIPMVEPWLKHLGLNSGFKKTKGLS